MKGIVFTEFFEMVEDMFGYAIVDEIIEASDLPSEGIYTAVGTYDHSEMVKLITNLSQKTQTPIGELLKYFGRYLFDAFLNGYPVFFENCKNGFEFLKSIDNHIHVEVRKLYPDADLPQFDCLQSNNKMELTYRSERKMSSLAEGLIERTMEHYQHDYQMEKTLIASDGSQVQFTIALNE